MSRGADSRSIVLRNCRLIDGTGADPLARAALVVEGDRISQVGASGQVSVPDGASVIDLDGATVMPGLIDSHLHLWGLSTDRIVEELLMVPDGVRLVRAGQRVGRLLEAGYTTVKDCGGTNALHLRRAIAEGTLLGPRIVAAGYFLSQTFGHGDFFHFLPMENSDARLAAGVGSNLTCDGVDECTRAARFALRQGADFIKISTSGGIMSERDRSEHVQFTPEEVSAIARVANNAGTFVTAHSHSAEGIRMSIEAGVRTVDHALFPDDAAIEEGRRRGVVFVSTLSIMKHYGEGGTSAGYPEWAVRKSRLAWDSAIVNMRRIHDSGGTLAAGTDFIDSDLMSMGANALELELLVKRCGLKPMDAIKAATLNGAKACNLERSIGTLEEGKVADIVVSGADPLADITVLQQPADIRLVIKEGRICVDRRAHPGSITHP